MQTTIDDAGRLVIPEEIRRQASLLPGQPLDIRWHDGRIEIEPASLPVKLVKQGHLVVAIPEIEVDPLTVEDVEATRQAILMDRETEMYGD